VDRGNTVGNSPPSHPSADGHFVSPYDQRDRLRDTFRGNEHESAYRGPSGSVYGRRPGDARGQGEVLYGRGTFGPPVDPWDESRAATETWLTITMQTRPPSTSDVGADRYVEPDDYRTDEFAACEPEGNDMPAGTVYRSVVATATFAPAEVDERPRRAARRHAGRRVRPQRVGWRRTRPSHRRSPMWAKLFVAFGALIMIAGVGAIVVVKIGLNQVNHAIPTENLLGEMAAKPVAAAAGPSIPGPINFLLVGVDTRPSGNIGSHSDTIIIAHIPASHDRVYLVSIPRDTSTIIPADEKTQFGGGSYKINAAFTFGSWHGGGEAGGFQLLAKTIKNAYGITFNGGAIVNFDGFTDIVNRLGGVNMYVDETTVSIHRGTDRNGKSAKPYKINPNTGVPVCSNRHVTFDSNPIACALPGVTPVVYKKGQRHLTATDALDFVRSRDGLVGTDYARQRHQQQFIKAVLTEVYQKGLSDPFKLGSFLTSVGKAFVFDGGGVSLQDWLFALKGITPGSMITIKTNDGEFVRYTGKAPDARQSLNATSLKLLDAVRNHRSKTDTVGQFVAAHPDWVAQS
jgi:polyisoprenyl-teichoic acid--peptidoglycan teichoic acid transferase